MNIIKSYLTKSDCYRSGRRISPIGIQVHSIGTAQRSAASLAEYWNQPGIDACVHYAADAGTQGKILQFLPESYRSWADAGYGNNNLISIEMMESNSMKYNANGTSYQVLNEEKFKEDILHSYWGCIEFCASICKKNGWNPMKKLESGLYLISSHNEGRLAGLSSAHVDPTHVWDRLGLTMNGFRKQVQKQLEAGGMPPTPPDEKKYYRLRLSWNDAKSQIGAYESLENAKRDCRPGYHIYDWTGKKVYSCSRSSEKLPYMVRVKATVLNIRSGPGAQDEIAGQITDQGAYTIVEEKGDWGRLQSGYGWIKLSYTEKI